MLRAALRGTFLLALCLLVPMLAVSSVTQSDEYGEAVFTEINGVKNILFLGRDDSSGLADSVILASVDTEQTELTLVQIPRDTYIALGEDSYKKINGASGVLGGDAKLCDKLSQAFGLRVDGYISFDTRIIKDLVDTLGGVEVNVPMDMDYDDPYQNLSIHLQKGKQRLTGSEAVGFVRYRAGYLRADLGRIDAQKIFLSAFAKSALEKLGSDDILPLARLTLRYIKTDLPVTALASLAKAMFDITPEKINFVTLPGEEVQSSKSGAWFYILSQSGCEQLLTTLGCDGGFDGDHIFSDERRAEFEEIYDRAIEAKIYNAAQIDGEGIEIAHGN